MKSKDQWIFSAALGVSLLFAACSKAAPGASPSTNGSNIPSPASLQQFQPHEDGWQNDPANQPHPNDPNPLRRALGDAPIIHNLFGVRDLMSLATCAKLHAGIKLTAIESANYLPHCPALEQDLLKRAHDAGFASVTANDVFDPHVVHY